ARPPAPFPQLTAPSARGAPLPKEGAFFVEDGNAVQPLVANIDIPILVQGDGSRPGELAIAFATGAELRDVLLVERDRRDADPIGAVFTGPIDNIDHIIRGQGQVYRIPEPGPGKLVPAQRVTVAKRPIFDAKKVRTHSASFVVIECMLLLLLREGRREGPCHNGWGHPHSNSLPRGEGKMLRRS